MIFRLSDNFKRSRINFIKFGEDPFYITYIYHIYHASLSGLNPGYTNKKHGNLSRISFATRNQTSIVCAFSTDNDKVWIGKMLHDLVPYCNLLHHQMDIYHPCYYFAMTEWKVQWWYTPFSRMIKTELTKTFSLVKPIKAIWQWIHERKEMLYFH